MPVTPLGLQVPEAEPLGPTGVKVIETTALLMSPGAAGATDVSGSVSPVVASSLTGIPEIVDHGENGLLVKPGDPTELARAIDLVLSAPSLRERFGAAGRSKAEQLFDLKQNTGELYRLIGQSAAVGSL